MNTPAILDSLAGTLTILPTAEAARALRRTFDNAQRTRGLQAWQPATILSWQQLLDQLWSEAIVSGIETRLLLNTTQEHALWLDTVTSKPTEATLTSPDSLADLAAQAWSLANAYNATNRLRATATTHDARIFATWAEAFTRSCERNNYLSRAALEAALAEHITTHKLPAPTSLTLIGFLHLTPAQQSLLEALRTTGTTINEQPLASSKPTTHLLTATSEQEELRGIAYYLRTFLEQHQQARIAVLIPEADDAPAIDSIFRELLAPELQSIHADPSSAPWEFSTSGPLTAQPIIATALDLTHFANTALDLNKASALLLSPYLGTTTDRETASRFDAESLRQHPSLRPEIDITALLRLAQTSAAPTWLKPFHQFVTNTTLETQRTFADWAEFTRSLLASTNWPGPRTLTSLEYQATEAWDALLDQLSTLDFRGKRIPYADFLHALTRQATAALFQPASTNAPIQILAPTTAIGQLFDSIILTRAIDTNYPPTEQTNPLLSFTLQSQLDMPGANPTTSATRSNQALTQLLNSAPNILITYTPETSEGTQRLAPTFEALSPEPWTLNSEPSHLEPVTTIETADTTALPQLPSHEVRGGARVLKLQAACGFLAFSELRLHSTELETQSPGFDALESGSILHRTLEKFWRAVQTQDTLRTMTREGRAELLTQCIDSSIPSKLITETDWDKAYLALQKDRLRIVLQNWLDKELERGPFTVLASEKEELITIGPLTLQVRMDRIDQVEGGHVFVDYKTGYAADPSQWEGDRPDDPQLPLYALFSEPDELKALAFARVRAGNGIEWRGYQSELGILPGKKITDINNAIEQWRNTLESLASDFANGIADVNPKDFAINCKRCAQRLLCRINPEAFLAQQDEDDTPTGDETE
jgi:ATP-dependent helicase/nuclease subunit B